MKFVVVVKPLSIYEQVKVTGAGVLLQIQQENLIDSRLFFPWI